MKRQKQGVSLIVLVITIIVMIVLAATVIISLSGTNIFNRAEEAVNKTNLKEVQSAASLVWMEAYLDESITTDAEYDTYVKNKLREQGVNVDNYYLKITKDGVTVKEDDSTAPIITVATETASIKPGEQIVYTVAFSDNEELGEINLTAEKITLNGFTATVAISGTGNVRTITLSNVQGAAGNKTITIAARVVIDTSGNASQSVTSEAFELEQGISTLGALITSAEMYGTKVNYEANGVTDWKVFYKQTVGTEEYVYLIASEQLAYNKVPTIFRTLYEATITEATVQISDTDSRQVGQIYWITSPSGVAVASTAKDKWLAKWSDYSSNENVKIVSYFLKEDIWSSFANTTEYVDVNGNSYVKGAIGTPTAEMFVASWNEKREATGNTTKYDKKLKLESDGTNGYYVNDITNGEATRNEYSQLISASDSLYIWSTNENSSVRLASPAAKSDIMFLYAYYSGKVSYNNCALRVGMRPVVCLNSEIPATIDTNGNIVI